MEFVDGRRPLSAGQLRWRTYTGQRVIVHAPEQSYAVTRATAELRSADRVVAALEDVCKPAREQRGQHIHIYLLDPASGLPRPPDDMPSQSSPDPAADAGRVIRRVVGPEAPGEPLAGPITRLLVRQWFGPAAASATLFVTGLAGVIGARTATGPTLQEAEDWVRAELAAGRTVSIFGSATADGVLDGKPATTNYASTAFISFLIKTFGTDTPRQFLALYDPDRRDQAALSVYQRPFGGLEESWLTSLQQRSSQNAAFRALFSYLVPLVRPYWLRQLELLGLMLLGLSYSLALPLTTKYLIDTILPDRNIPLLLIVIGGLFAFYTINMLLSMRRAYVTGWLSQRILMQLQERMFTHLQHLPHAFYARSKVGDLVTRFSSDITVVQQAMMQILGVGLFLALRTVGAVVALLILSPVLGLTILTIIPLFAFTYVTLRARLQQLSYAQQRQMGEGIALVQENVSAHALVKAFGLEHQAVAGYRQRLATLSNTVLRLVMMGALFEMSLISAVTMGELLILGLGGYMVIQGQVTIGTLLAFIGLLPSLLQPVATLAGIGRTVQTASGSLDRVSELLNEPTTIANKPDAATLPPLQTHIRLEHVGFAYDHSRTILNDLDVTIPAGSHVAIVGPSGSGKSTIVSLLLRFWDPDVGRISFDDYDIRDVSLSSLRGQIGLVFQDTFIFDTTLRENIALGRPTATDAEIAAAAKAAQLDSYIATLPSGYDTVLGERGVRMSGGQRQRLAIARVLLRDPSVLIFDEATSALDAQTERDILETLLTVARSRTTISITHRLTLAAIADHIIVLDQGRVVEQGSHELLIHSGGLYQRLYEEQMGHIIERHGQPHTLKALQLGSVPLFASLTSEALSLLAQQLEVEHYPENTEIVRQGETGDKLYIIKEGQVEVLVTNEGVQRRVNELSINDYFGEMALLTAEPRVATVRSTQPTTLYSLKQSDFHLLLEREPLVKRAITEVVSARQSALLSIAEVTAE